MSHDDGLDPTPEEMRAMGYAVVDHLVDRLASLDHRPAWGGGDRAEMEEHQAALRDRLGSLEEGVDGAEGFEALMDLLATHVLAHRGSVDHPRFFAFVPSSPTWPGILGDFLVGGLNVFQGTWLESAGPSALELEVLGWFKEWVGYPREAAGLLLSGGSAANLTALATAREARLGEDWDDGVLYTSGEAHSSIFRAARILGFREERIRVLPPGPNLALDPGTVAEAARQDRARGLHPFLVVANGGATSTGVVDPLPSLADLCRREDLWLHVDAAYGGFAVLTEAGRGLLEGLGRADSLTLDPHKWLFQPFEAGCLLVRDGHALVDAFHILPDYLQDTEVERRAAADDAEVNFADRGPQLTRSFRALKVWLTVRYWGLHRIREAIGRGIHLAAQAEAWIRASETFELLAPAALGIVCFRSTDGEDADTQRVQRLAAGGTGMISSTRVRGEYALRLCILSHRSSWADVEAVLEDLAAPLDGVPGS